jgi:hypothetical protein
MKTSQMNESQYVEERINQAIGILKNLTWNDNCVDGETMQYILKEVGMEDQMLRQLMFISSREQVEDLYDEFVEYRKVRGY